MLMLSQYGQEKFDRYKGDFSSSPFELCSYFQKSISLSINVGRSCGTVVVTATATPATAAVQPTIAGMLASPASNPGLAGDEMGVATGELLMSEEHYKKNHNSLKILVALCHGLKNEDTSNLINFDKEVWCKPGWPKNS